MVAHNAATILAHRSRTGKRRVHCINACQIFLLTGQVHLLILAPIRRDVAAPWVHEFRTMPTMRATLSPFLISPAIKGQTLTACGAWYGPRLNSETFSASSLRVLVLWGVLVGVLVLLQWSGLGHESPPQNDFSLICGVLDDSNDAPLSLADLTARRKSAPLVSTLRGISSVAYGYSWPLRYLARPQRLTRL